MEKISKMKKHIFYITYTPKVEYNGTIPTDPKQFKDLVESIWDTDGKKIVEKLLVRNIDTKIDFRGIYYNKKFKFIGIVQLPTKNADIEHYKDYMTLYTLSGTGEGTSADLTPLNTAIEALKKELADLKAKGLQGSITEDKVKELINNSAIETNKIIESLKKDNSTEITKLLQEILNNKETIKETIKNIAEIQKLEREFNQKLTETNNKVTTLESKTTTLETKTKELETKANGILSKEELLKLLGDAKVKNSDNLGGIPSSGFIRNYMNNSLTDQDLNSIDYPGFFSQKDKTKALAAKNYPKDSLIGILFVGNSVSPQQVYFANETNEIYVRSKTAGDWTTWTKTSLDFNSIKPEIETLITEKTNTVIESKLANIIAKDSEKLGGLDKTKFIRDYMTGQSSINNRDINDITEPGFYYIDSDSLIHTENYPENFNINGNHSESLLIVSFISQPAQFLITGYGQMYFRYKGFMAGTLMWYPWQYMNKPIDLPILTFDITHTSVNNIYPTIYRPNLEITLTQAGQTMSFNNSVFSNEGISGMIVVHNTKNISDFADECIWATEKPTELRDTEYFTYMVLPGNKILLGRVY
nr:MAG TPA: putative tail fiber protein [Caudoviricetes sp.]